MSAALWQLAYKSAMFRAEYWERKYRRAQQEVDSLRECDQLRDRLRHL